MSVSYRGLPENIAAPLSQARPGDRIFCYRCGQIHRLEIALPGVSLLYRCGGLPLLAAVYGRLLPHLERE